MAGLAAGFTTMIGNAAGAITSIYLLSMRLPKNAFIGTAAWFFLIINLLKVALQVFFWENISAATLTFNALMVPAIAVGAVIGIIAAGKIPERAYRVFVMVMTGVAGYHQTMSMPAIDINAMEPEERLRHRVEVLT